MPQTLHSTLPVFPVISLLVLIVALPGSPVSADEPDVGLPSWVSFNAGSDQEGSTDQALDLVLNGLPLAASLRFSAVTTQHEVGGVAFDTRSLAWGISSDPLEQLEVGFDWSEWDSRNEFAIDSRSPWLRFNATHFALTGRYHARDISAQRVDSRVVEFESTGYSLEFDYLGAETFWFGASHSNYNYSIDVTRINSDRILFSLSPAVRLYAFGLEDRATTVWYGLFIGDVSIDVTWRTSVSAVTAERANATTLSADYPLLDQLSINANLGWQRSEGSDALGFYGAGFSYIW